MVQRRPLAFSSMYDVIADVNRLRRGYTPGGNWSLPQVCWHLDRTMQLALVEYFPVPLTPEQRAMRPTLDHILETGEMPAAIAPPHVTPPMDAPDSAIDDFLATLRRFFEYPGPYTPPRVFGFVNEQDMRRLTLIHSAHHLSHLLPMQARI